MYSAILLLSYVADGKIFDQYFLIVYPNPLLRYAAGLSFAPYFKVAIAVTSLMVYCGLVAAFERRPIGELALRKSAPELIAGLLIGLGLMASACGILAALGEVTQARAAPEVFWPSVCLSIVTAASASISEEIFFRGVLFRIFQQGIGTAGALALSALLFGLLHAMNSGVSITHALFIAAEAGFPLAMAYAATQRLWLPIGLHFGWDAAYGRIFGSAEPGRHVPGLLDLSDHASSVEISVMTVLPSLALAGYLGWRAKRRGLWRPMTWRLQLKGG